MESDELKRKLLGLWEKTTHNSKELLSNLFSYYFNENYLVYKEMDSKINCALCGIPFSFGYGHNLLRGLYIIVMTSDEGYQKKSFLSELLQELNEKLKDEFDFTFVVPQNEIMKDYYVTQGYFNSFYVFEERYTSVHDFKNDFFLSLSDSDDKIKNLKLSLFDTIKVVELKDNEYPTTHELINFIIKTEEKGSASVNLLHTYKDLDYLFGKDSIRHLNPYISFDDDNRITGVLFTQKEDVSRIKIVAYYVSDTCSFFSLLEYVKKQYPDYSLSIITSDPKYQSHSIITQIYASENPNGGNLENSFGVVDLPFNLNKLLQPMGMVRFLRFDRIMDYIAQTRSDVDFKLHIRNYNEISDRDGEYNFGEYFIVKNGRCQIAKLKTNKEDRSMLNLSIKEVSELLLRKNDTSNLIMEAFGIPRLNLQYKLLPY